MKAKDVYAVWKKHKAILTVPPGFGKMPVAEQVKILNKAARSKQAGMAGFVKDYNELKQQSKTSGPAVKGGKGGKGGVDTTGKKIGLKPKVLVKEPVKIDWVVAGPSMSKIVKGRMMVDPQIAIQKEKRQARDLRKKAEKQAANILNITLDNVIAKVEENEAKRIREDNAPFRKATVRKRLKYWKGVQTENLRNDLDNYTTDRDSREVKRIQDLIDMKVWRLDTPIRKRMWETLNDTAKKSAPPPDMRNWYVQQYNAGGGSARYGDFDINRGDYNTPGPWVPRGSRPDL